MEHAYQFEKPEDFNVRESAKLESLNLETRRALIDAAAQTLFSAVARETEAAENYAFEKAQADDSPTKVTHYIEWGRGKNEFITDDTVSCKLAQKMNKEGVGEGIIYEVLFPIKIPLQTAKYLLENFDSQINKAEFYIVKTDSEEPKNSRYYYINEIGIAEYEPYGLEENEHAIELAFFIESKNNIPLPILTAEKEMHLYADLIKMKLVPYKISTI